MACHRFAGAVSAHAAGEPIDARAAAHLAVCADCRQHLAREAAVQRLIASALDDAASTGASPDFLPRLRAHVEQSRPPAVRVGRWAAMAATAAVVAVAVVTGMRTVRDRGESSVATSPAAIATPAASPDASAARFVAAAPARPDTRGAAPTPTVHASTAIRGTGAGVARRRVSAAEASASATRGPEVLVPDQRQAVRRLFEAAVAGRPAAVSIVLNARDAAAAFADPSALVVAPLRIEPVVVEPMVAAPDPIGEVKEPW